MDDLIELFELRHDADEIVDILQIEVEELIVAFPDRAKAYYEGCKAAEGDYDE